MAAKLEDPPEEWNRVLSIIGLFSCACFGNYYGVFGKKFLTELTLKFSNWCLVPVSKSPVFRYIE